MAMAEDVHRNTAGEIQVALATLADKVAAFASHRTHVTPRIDGHEWRDGHRKALLLGPDMAVTNSGNAKRRPVAGRLTKRAFRCALSECQWFRGAAPGPSIRRACDEPCNECRTTRQPTPRRPLWQERP